MEFSIAIPKRVVVFRISVEKPKHRSELRNPDHLVKHQLLADNVAREVKIHQDNYFPYK